MNYSFFASRFFYAFCSKKPTRASNGKVLELADLPKRSSKNAVKLRKHLSETELLQKDFQKILSRSKLPVFDLQRFSAEDEGRTELPSALRRREEREKGNVPRSQEIVSASVLFATTLVLLIFWQLYSWFCTRSI